MSFKRASESNEIELSSKRKKVSFEGCDVSFAASENVTFVVGADKKEVEFPEKFLLGASPWFDAALDGPFLEATSKRVVVDFEPVAFELFLRVLAIDRMAAGLPRGAISAHLSLDSIKVLLPLINYYTCEKLLARVVTEVNVVAWDVEYTADERDKIFDIVADIDQWSPGLAWDPAVIRCMVLASTKSVACSFLREARGSSRTAGASRSACSATSTSPPS
jgi:hypothetical protein